MTYAGGMMEELLVLARDPQAWAALATLVVMEVVLGIDNLIFISILTNKLPEEKRSGARRIGIGLAVFLRLALLGGVAFIVQLTAPIFSLFGHGFSWRDLILIGGGLFLIYKATSEIHDHVTTDHEDKGPSVGGAAGVTVAGVIGQILLLDLVFSLDSIITAVGMTAHVEIMVIAVIVAVAVMLAAADGLALTDIPLTVAARAALRIGTYSPLRHAGAVMCPALIQVTADDALCPTSATRKALSRMADARLESYPGQHFDVYVEPLFDTVVADQIAFLRLVAPVAR